LKSYLRNLSETKRFTDAICSKVEATGKRELIGWGEIMLKGIAMNLSSFENKPDFSHQSRYFIATPRIASGQSA
jgi:hypothetical protein